MALMRRGKGIVDRPAIVVEGPLAFRMRRIQAAREGDLGLKVFTVPQLAARIAVIFQEVVHSV